MALVHRGSVRQPEEAVAPTTHHGLTRSRTARAGSPATPKKARARAMAEAVKSLLVSASRGATVAVASHRWHWKRRTSTHRSCGTPSGVGGPRSCRERRPWPCRTISPPAGWLAAPHAGHRAGRTSAAVGFFSTQVLTSSSLRMTSLVPRVSLFLKFQRGARPGACVTTSRVTSSRSSREHGSGNRQPRPDARVDLSQPASQGTGWMRGAQATCNALPINHSARELHRFPHSPCSVTPSHTSHASSVA